VVLIPPRIRCRLRQVTLAACSIDIAKNRPHLMADLTATKLHQIQLQLQVLTYSVSRDLGLSVSEFGYYYRKQKRSCRDVFCQRQVNEEQLKKFTKNFKVYRYRHWTPLPLSNSRFFERKTTSLQSNLVKAASDLYIIRRKLGPPFNTMFLESPRVSTPSKISIRLAVFAQRSHLKPRDRQMNE